MVTWREREYDRVTAREDVARLDGLRSWWLFVKPSYWVQNARPTGTSKHHSITQVFTPSKTTTTPFFFLFLFLFFPIFPVYSIYPFNWNSSIDLQYPPLIEASILD